MKIRQNKQKEPDKLKIQNQILKSCGNNSVISKWNEHHKNNECTSGFLKKYSYTPKYNDIERIRGLKNVLSAKTFPKDSRCHYSNKGSNGLKYWKR